MAMVDALLEAGADPDATPLGDAAGAKDMARSPIASPH
jgi:hypothetical protein